MTALGARVGGGVVGRRCGYIYLHLYVVHLPIAYVRTSVCGNTRMTASGD